VANIIFFLIQIGLNSVLGLVAFVLLPLVNRKPASGQRVQASSP